MYPSKLPNYYWYITALLVGFFSFALLLKTYEADIDSDGVYGLKTVSGIIVNVDQANNTLKLLTIDELKYNALTDSVYEVEVRLNENTTQTNRNFTVTDGVNSEFYLTDLGQELSLRLGDYVYIYYKNTPSGLEADVINSGTPVPMFGFFTPQYLELQSQVLLGQQQQ